jgi:hypothetical protein
MCFSARLHEGNPVSWSDWWEELYICESWSGEKHSLWQKRMQRTQNHCLPLWLPYAEYGRSSQHRGTVETQDVDRMVAFHLGVKRQMGLQAEIMDVLLPNLPCHVAGPMMGLPH